MSQTTFHKCIYVYSITFLTSIERLYFKVHVDIVFALQIFFNFANAPLALLMLRSTSNSASHQRPWIPNTHAGLCSSKCWFWDRLLGTPLKVCPICLHWNWKKLFCKVDSLFWRVNFFPPNFSLVFWKRKIWLEKILCKRVRSLETVL